jgi:hypothetical protein
VRAEIVKGPGVSRYGSVLIARCLAYGFVKRFYPEAWDTPCCQRGAERPTASNSHGDYPITDCIT